MIGWMEFVPPPPNKGSAEIEAFYARRVRFWKEQAERGGSAAARESALAEARAYEQALARYRDGVARP